MGPHLLAEARSVAYPQAVAERLRQDPALLEVARQRVRGWVEVGTPAGYYARAWEEILAMPLDEIIEVMTASDERACALRQVTPFAGFIPPSERWRLWREVRARYSENP